MGMTEGWVRLTTKDAAVALYDKIQDGMLTIRQTRIFFEVLEGEEEAVYLKKAAELIIKKNRYNSLRTYEYWFGKQSEQGRKRKLREHNEEPACKRS